MKLNELFEAKKKPKEPDWPDADYASGFSKLRDMQSYLSKKNMNQQLFVPKNRDPKEIERIKRDRDWRDIKREFPDEKLKESASIPILTSFREAPPGDNKPGRGFWTSSAIRTADNTYTSRWYKFVQSNFPTWQTDYGYLFDVKPSATVFDLSHAEQYYHWAMDHSRMSMPEREYYHPYSDSDMRARFPWDQLARHFDAAYHGGWSSREFTYGWDVESTVWFNTDVLIYRGAVKLSHGDDDNED